MNVSTNICGSLQEKQSGFKDHLGTIFPMNPYNSIVSRIGVMFEFLEVERDDFSLAIIILLVLYAAVQICTLHKNSTQSTKLSWKYSSVDIVHSL